MASGVNHVSSAICSRRGGYALILVLGLVAAVAVLGIAYIEANGVSVQGSMNLSHVSRARYLAESGVEQAIYWLGISNPPGANADGYWPGASRQRVDDTSDYYDVTVERDPGDANRYKITSVGNWMSTPTSVGLAHRAVVWVRTQPDPTVQAQHALLLEGGTTLPRNQTYVGSVHSNDWVVSSATIQGNLTACGFALWFVRPTGQVQGSRPAVSFPNFLPKHMAAYRHGQTDCQAVTYDFSNLDQTFPNKGPGGGSNPTWNITETNPGGIIICTNTDHGRRKVTIKNTCTITGTVVIDGDICIEGGTININAVTGFPAIVCTGDIFLDDHRINVTVNGAILVGGTIRRNANIEGGRLAVNGFIHSHDSLPLVLNDGFAITTNLTNNASRGWLYDLTIPPDEWPAGNVSVESWTDR